MTQRNALKLGIGGLLALCASVASAQTVTIGSASVAPGGTANIPVTFAPGANAVGGIQIDFTFARPPGVASGTVSITPGTGTCGGTGTSSATGTGLSATRASSSALAAETLCTFNIPISAAATPGTTPFTITFEEYSNPMGGAVSVTSVNGSITVTGGGNTPPALGYTPGVATTINYPAGGAGPSISVSNAGGGSGSGAAATTTLTNCTITGGGAAFPTTNFNPNITAVGTGAPSPASFTLPNCSPQAAAQNATLTCVETRNGVAFSPAPTWPLTCPAAVANSAPTVTYNPTAGTTINFPAGAAGAATSSVTVTSAGGTGTGSVTVNNCTATAGFTVTNAPINLTGTAGGAQINGAVNLSCTRGGAVQNGTLSCTETPTPAVGGSPFTRTWPLVCPAATVANVPPTLTYNPAPSVSAVPPGGPFTSIAYGASANIQVLCASPSPDGTACGGSGAGDPATARLQNISVAFIGPPFSPVPNNLSCVFANQANGTVASPLNFVATQADPGNIRCTCANNPTSGDNYRVSVQEISPVGGNTVTRNFDITCGGAGVVCGSLTATPPSGNITLNNGGAAVQVTALQAAGISAPNTRSVTCAVTGASAGSTFTVTPASPISVAGTAVNVTASCANTATTTGTATLTCTAAANNPLQGCPALTATYTLTCPGVVAPPVVPVEPVPVMSDAGRMLLASLVLLLGLVAVGFRLRN